MNIPAELKPLAPYIQRAKEIKTKYPVVSYYCTTYALKKGIELRAQSPESRSFLAELMDKVEKEREQLREAVEINSETEGKSLVLKVASDVFNHADSQDKAGDWSKATAMAFLAASQYYEVLNYFGEIDDEEILQKIKYSRFKAADINVAIKTGRKPEPEIQKEVYIPPDPSAPMIIPGELSSIPSLSPQVFETHFSSPQPTNPTNTSSNMGFQASPSQAANFQPYSHDTHHNTDVPISDIFNHVYNSNQGPPINHLADPRFTQPNSSTLPYYTTNTHSNHLQTNSYLPPTSNSSNYSHHSYPPSNPTPPPATIQKACKHARFAISALQFDDVSTAISNLQSALNELLPYQQP